MDTQIGQVPYNAVQVRPAAHTWREFRPARVLSMPP
jgi:hypothetical protein